MGGCCVQFETWDGPSGEVIGDLLAKGLPVAAWREHGINLGMLVEPTGV